MILRKLHLLWILVSHLCNVRIDSKVFSASKRHWFAKRIKDGEQNKEHSSSLKLEKKNPKRKLPQSLSLPVLLFLCCDSLFF